MMGGGGGGTNGCLIQVGSNVDIFNFSVIKTEEGRF